MNDPRLNSVHLNVARRQQFRVARASLLNAGGPQTLAAERGGVAGAVGERHTAVESQPDGWPDGVQFALADRDYVYPLKVGINTVGRMPDNDVVVEDPYVSRRHIAILVHANGACEIHDVASKNGTFINDRPVHGPTGLRPGDRIVLSDHELIFLRKADGAELPPSDHTHTE